MCQCVNSFQAWKGRYPPLIIKLKQNISPFRYQSLCCSSEPCKPLSGSVRQVLFSDPFSSGGNQGSERLGTRLPSLVPGSASESWSSGVRGSEHRHSEGGVTHGKSPETSDSTHNSLFSSALTCGCCHLRVAGEEQA